MAKLSAVKVKRPEIEELLHRSQPDADIAPDHDTDLASSDNGELLRVDMWDVSDIL